MKGFFIACLVLGLVSFGVAGVSSGFTKSCIIVTDGTRKVHDHELAHCNGWDHPAFEPADPPARYVRPYPGRLTLIRCGRRFECKSVQAMCKKLWAKHGYTANGYTETPGYTNFNGCSIDP